MKQKVETVTSGEEAGTLHSGVLSQLRDIVSGSQLDEGERIPERELCIQLGVSRTPLREALKVLASEGLVELLPNRGARIPVLSPADVRELFEIIAGLESTAGRLACLHLTDEQIARIEELHYGMYASYMRRDLEGYSRSNAAIHQLLISVAGNTALASLHEGVTRRVFRVRRKANLASYRDRWAEAMREHETMLDAIHRRAGNELADILFAHFQRKSEALLERMEELEERIAIEA